MVTDTTTDAQLRRTIQKTIEQEMPLRLLKRIVYEVRCASLEGGTVSSSIMICFGRKFQQ